MAASTTPFAADTNSATASTAIAAHVTPTGASQQKQTGVVNRILLDGTNQDAYQIILIMGASLFGMLFELFHQEPSLFQQVAEAPRWYRWAAGYPYLFGLLIPPVLCPLAAFTISRQHTSRASAAAAGARLGAWVYLALHGWACAAILTLHNLDPDQPHLASDIHPLPAFGMVIAAALLATVSSWRTTVTGLVGLFLLEFIVRLYAGSEGLLEALTRAGYSTTFAGCYCLPINWLIGCARQIDTESQRNSHEEDLATRLGAQLAGSRHARNLVHDHVLAALVSSFPERGMPAKRLRAAAADALELLKQPTHSDGHHTTTDLVDQLRSWCQQHTHPQVEYQFASAADPELGTEADLSLSEDEFVEVLAASLEALRNVAAHSSGGNPQRHVHCTVSTQQSAGTLTITIADDGVGFDTDCLSPLRLGLRQSIVGRMRHLPGGHASVSSEIGHGTTVQLGLRKATPEAHTADALPLTGDGLSATVHGHWGRIGLGCIVLTAWAHVMRSSGTPAHVLASIPSAVGVTCSFLALAWPPRGRTRALQRWGILSASALSTIPFLTWGTLTPTLELASWPQGYSAIFTVLLLHQRRLKLALVNLGVVGAAHLLPVVMIGAPAAPFVRSFGFQCINILTVATVIALVRSIEPRITAMQRQAHQAQVLRTARQARLEAETTLLTDVSRRSRPVLEQLRSLTDAPSDALVQLARRVEAELRDLIRVPRLASQPALVAAVQQARDRGVDVIQLDDSQQDTDLVTAPPPLPTTLVDTATRMLHRAKNGESVVLRLCPPHSPYAATIQRRGAAGAIALERIRRAS